MTPLYTARMMMGVKKGPWSEVEDKRLLDLVNFHGAESWMDISKEHGTRNAKQCRERYHQNLKSSINRGPITPEEGVAIERFYAEKGPKWAEIARALGGRSDNQVKNWYNGQKNRRTKMSVQNCHSVLHGTSIQPSLSAVKPVDVQLLQQRGHTNPYCRRSDDHQPKLSPTASQISEAPSLISDASSSSSGISPSPKIAYPCQSELAATPFSSWNEDSSRPVLPPLCTAVPSTRFNLQARMSISLPPLVPPSRQLDLQTTYYMDQRRRQESHLIHEPQQVVECHHTPPLRLPRSSPMTHHQPDYFSQIPSGPPSALLHHPPSHPTVYNSHLELAFTSGSSLDRRQSPPAQPPHTSCRRTAHTTCRYMPYPSEHRLSDESERTARERMKLTNILER